VAAAQKCGSVMAQGPTRRHSGIRPATPVAMQRSSVDSAQPRTARHERTQAASEFAAVIRPRAGQMSGSAQAARLGRCQVCPLKRPHREAPRREVDSEPRDRVRHFPRPLYWSNVGLSNGGTPCAATKVVSQAGAGDAPRLRGVRQHGLLDALATYLNRCASPVRRLTVKQVAHRR
jgi:hypothetical protein